jgi:hypothetical protein
MTAAAAYTTLAHRLGALAEAPSVVLRVVEIHRHRRGRTRHATVSPSPRGVHECHIVGLARARSWALPPSRAGSGLVS